MIMCHQQHVEDFVAGLGELENVMVLVNSLTAVQVSKFDAKRLQLIIQEKKETKAIKAWAICKGPKKVETLQKAMPVTVMDSDTVWGNLKLNKEDVSDAEYKAFSQKEGLAALIGPLIRVVNFTNRRLLQEPEGLKWTFECPREVVPDLLRCSGTKEVVISVGKDEEQKMNIHPVFVSSSSASTILTLIEGLDHYGVCGPTRTGHFVVRSSEKALADIRKACLTSTSTYSHAWHLVIKRRYTARFPACHSMMTIATSLSKSLRWPCVGLSQKMVGKRHRQVVLGSEAPPPSLRGSIRLRDLHLARTDGEGGISLGHPL